MFCSSLGVYLMRAGLGVVRRRDAYRAWKDWARDFRE